MHADGVPRQFVAADVLRQEDVFVNQKELPATGTGELAGGIPRHIPIVAMTAHAMRGDREICLQAGMDDYISKPIHLKVLHELINRVRPRPAAVPYFR